MNERSHWQVARAVGVWQNGTAGDPPASRAVAPAPASREFKSWGVACRVPGSADKAKLFSASHNAAQAGAVAGDVPPETRRNLGRIASAGPETRIAIFEFIEGFYSPRRRHSSLGYMFQPGCAKLLCRDWRESTPTKTCARRISR